MATGPNRAASRASAATMRRRPYAGGCRRLAGSFRIRHGLSDRGARRLWQLLKTGPQVTTLGALTGIRASQQMKAIHLSSRQVAADADTAGIMYPDQSPHPLNSVLKVARRIDNALRRTVAH